jgi:hypothetical protein
MVNRELLVQPPVESTSRTAPAAFDAGFDDRWAAWVARGRVHEQRARRRFITRACTLAIACAAVYAFFR